MAIKEQIVTGRFYRTMLDVANKTWQRISFWTKSTDVEFNDGMNAEAKLGAIKGITDSTNVTENGYAADAKIVSELNNSLGGCVLKQEGNDFYIVGADSVSKKLGSGEPETFYLHCNSATNYEASCIVVANYAYYDVILP